MHFIASQSQDNSAHHVLEWMDWHNAIFKIVYDLKFEKEITTEFSLSDENILDLTKIDSIWYRRPDVNRYYSTIHKGLYKEEEENLTHSLQSTIEMMNAEMKRLKSFYWSAIDKRAKKKLGSFEILGMNKLITLNKAKSFGIDIPATLVTTSKQSLENFIKKCKLGVITKAIEEGINFIKSTQDGLIKDYYANYTEEITSAIFEKIPDNFHPSLFQEKLDKEYEIRTFFMVDKCYSMVIFSQNDDQTSVDFRRYNHDKPNRNAPYKLSNELEKKVVELMKDLKLNTGSLDFVKTKDGRMVFLEVNPVGQYGMVSYPCNYHLDKKIAEYLLDL